MKVKGYNRNLIGGRRPHKGCTKLQHLSISERIIKESYALMAYQKRVGQYKEKK